MQRVKGGRGRREGGGGGGEEGGSIQDSRTEGEQAGETERRSRIWRRGGGAPVTME
jgi:hypothetical protein